MVYGMEAHAEDEWPIGSRHRYRQHRSNVERARAARDFSIATQLKWRLVLDPIENPFEAVFAAWPVRMYIIHKGKIAYKAQPKGAGYEFTEVGAWLAAHCTKESSS